MSSRTWQERVQDILDAAHQIGVYVRGMTLERFVDDTRTFDAVVRNIVIIGEAANHLPIDIRARLSDVPWGDIIGMRNRLVHRYFQVDSLIVWNAATRHVPPLASQLQSHITSPTPHDHHPSRTLTLIKTIADWRPRTPFYYGWLILAMSAVGTYAATGSTQLVLGGVQNFIFEDMGWDRSTIAYAVTAGTWASGLITPFVGTLADRYGPRGLMPIAAFIAGLCFFAIAGMQAVWHFYAAYIVARTIASPMLVGVVPRTAAVNFFNRRRNLALGISAMARPFGGAINIQIFSLIALAASWRTAFQVQGIISLLIVIPLFLVMRRSPADIGLQADGAAASRKRSAPTSDPSPSDSDNDRPAQSPASENFDWTAGQAARTSAFWLIIIAEALVILMSGTINFQIVPYLRDVGISPAIAAGALSLSSLLGSLGNPFWGWLSDIFSPRRLALITLAISGCAVSLFVIVPEGRLSLVVVILYGSLAGGLNILGHMMIAQYFGRSSFGSITGLMGPFQTGALGLGPTLGSLLYRITGGYRTIYLFGVLSYILALACILATRQPKHPIDKSPLPLGEG